MWDIRPFETHVWWDICKNHWRGEEYNIQEVRHMSKTTKEESDIPDEVSTQVQEGTPLVSYWGTCLRV